MAVPRAGGADAAPILEDRERRCLTMIAFAEAASEGLAGMAAVMRVVRNRLAHPSFPKDSCAVALQDGQFQPVGERSALRQALAAPEGKNLSQVLGATSRASRLALVQAWRIAAMPERVMPRDPTGGALYFVNPRLMDPAKCPWFAGLKRTATIGRHVFMTHYRPGEPKLGPALDCAAAGKERGGSKLVAAAAHGLFDPRGPKIATRPVPPATLQAWRRSGELAKRQAILRRAFPAGWRAPEGP
jgi:hypothetical protein